MIITYYNYLYMNIDIGWSLVEVLSCRGLLNHMDCVWDATSMFTRQAIKAYAHVDLLNLRANDCTSWGWSKGWNVRMFDCNIISRCSNWRVWVFRKPKIQLIQLHVGRTKYSATLLFLFPGDLKIGKKKDGDQSFHFWIQDQPILWLGLAKKSRVFPAIPGLRGPIEWPLAGRRWYHLWGSLLHHGSCGVFQPCAGSTGDGSKLGRFFWVPNAFGAILFGESVPSFFEFTWTLGMGSQLNASPSLIVVVVLDVTVAVPQSFRAHELKDKSGQRTPYYEAPETANFPSFVELQTTHNSLIWIFNICCNYVNVFDIIFDDVVTFYMFLIVDFWFNLPKVRSKKGHNDQLLWFASTGTAPWAVALNSGPNGSRRGLVLFGRKMANWNCFFSITWSLGAFGMKFIPVSYQYHTSQDEHDSPWKKPAKMLSVTCQVLRVVPCPNTWPNSIGKKTSTQGEQRRSSGSRRSDEQWVPGIRFFVVVWKHWALIELSSCLCDVFSFSKEHLAWNLLFQGIWWCKRHCLSARWISTGPIAAGSEILGRVGRLVGWVPKTNITVLYTAVFAIQKEHDVQNRSDEVHQTVNFPFPLFLVTGYLSSFYVFKGHGTVHRREMNTGDSTLGETNSILGSDDDVPSGKQLHGHWHF